MFSKIAIALAIAVAGLASTAALPQSASANHGNNYGASHVCQYKTVVTYKYEKVPYQKQVLKYKSCGTPYYVWQTFYKTVKVPVYKRVKVCCNY